MARHKKEFNKKEFENLCKFMCTEAEICDWFETTDKTLNKWCKRVYEMDFSECFKKFSLQGKISLRRAQFRSAIENNNVTMQIFLGKQYLGQKDKYETQVSASISVDVEKELAKVLFDE